VHAIACDHIAKFLKITISSACNVKYLN